jgi:hypothetical protein
VSTHREAMDWIRETYGRRGPVELRPELVATHEQRQEVARELRRVAERATPERRGALRDRALLIGLEEDADAAAELLAEAQSLGVEVVAE